MFGASQVPKPGSHDRAPESSPKRAEPNETPHGQCQVKTSTLVASCEPFFCMRRFWKRKEDKRKKI